MYGYIQNSLASVIHFNVDHINKRHNILHTFINVSPMYVLCITQTGTSSQP